MDNQQVYGLYEDYLRNEKKASANTLSSYLRDIRQLGEYLDSHTDEQYVTATEEDLSGYIAYLRSNGKSVATVSRAIASIKCCVSMSASRPPRMPPSMLK